MSATHFAVCRDDNLVVPLYRTDARCENDTEDSTHDDPRWQPVADGGPGPICEDCMADLNWTVPADAQDILAQLLDTAYETGFFDDDEQGDDLTERGAYVKGTRAVLASRGLVA